MPTIWKMKSIAYCTVLFFQILFLPEFSPQSVMLTLWNVKAIASCEAVVTFPNTAPATALLGQSFWWHTWCPSIAPQALEIFYSRNPSSQVLLLPQCYWGSVFGSNTWTPTSARNFLQQKPVLPSTAPATVLLGHSFW